MESSIMKNASRFLREQKKKKRWQKVLLCLALVVAAGTMIALIMPGQALTGTELVLDCQIEAPHQHTADCYAEDGSLICGLADYVAHAHNELCYNEEGELVCKLPEIEGHVHTDDCYAEELVLTCGLEETGADGEGTPAGTADPEEEGSPVSGGDAEASADSSLAPEEQTGHVHTADCYTTVRKLICGQLETVEHVHGDACFKEVGIEGNEGDMLEGEQEQENLDVSAGDLDLDALKDEWYFCGKKAHTHSDECYDALGDVLCGQEEHEHTEECLKEEAVYVCGLEEHVHDDTCYDSDGNLICGMQEHEHDEECIIRYWCGHVTHTHNAACYAGVDVTGGDNAAALNCGLEEHEHTEECLIVPILERVYEDGSIKVTASYPADAGIPDDADFRVEYIPEGSDEYHDCIFEAESIMQTQVNVFALLNIGFYREDGTEIAPEKEVNINVQFLNDSDVAYDEPTVVIHYAEEGAELIDNTGIGEDGSTSFVTDEFSPFFIGNGKNLSDPIDLNQDIAGFSPAIHKTIDYLGDNGQNGEDSDNPETDEDSKSDNDYADDLYRISLDITGSEVNKPVDLLIVLDLSSSMATVRPAAKDVPWSERSKRDWTMWKVLNGENKAAEGLIEKFLKVNESIEDPKDKSLVSVIYFCGKFGDVGKGLKFRDNAFANWGPFKEISGEGTESGVIIPWTDSYKEWEEDKFIDSGEGTYDATSNSIFQAKHFKSTNGDLSTTNYVAAMMRADYVLRQKEANNGHKKIVLFISDGLPTQYYKASDLTDDVWNNPNGIAANNLTRYGAGTDSLVYKDSSLDQTKEDGISGYLIGRYLGLKDKNGNDRQASYSDLEDKKDAGATPYVKETLLAFDQFYERNSDIKFYGVGIDLGTTADGVSYPRSYTLDEMSKKYGTQTIAIDSTTAIESIIEQFEQLLFPNNVCITDDLSTYVELYDDNANETADVLVTATNNTTGAVQYLWSGYGDGKGTGSVSVNGANKQLNNKIDGMDVVQNVRVDGDKIQVTFNPDYYLSSHYTYTLSFNVKLTDEAFDYYAQYHSYKSNIKGDAGTDYGDNKTSSGKEGFRSNDNAVVTYTAGGKKGSKEYPHPVVQAWYSKLIIEKKDQYGEVVKDAQFKLTRKDQKGQKGQESPVTPSKYGSRKDGYYTPDKDGIIEYDKLPTGTYTLEETAPSGYGIVTDKITFEVEDGRILKSSTSDKEASDTSAYSYQWSGDLWVKGSEDTRNYTNREYGEGVSLTITNDRLEAPIRIVKQDTAGNNVSGVKFKLYSKDSAETPIATGTSDGDGNVSWEISEFGAKYCHFKPVSDKKSLYLREGSYELEEDSTPEGYNKLDGRIPFEMVQGGDSLKLTGKDDTVDTSDPNDRQLWKFDANGGTITVVNKLNYVKLQLLKKGNVDPEYAGKDAMTGNGILTADGLGGAQFEIHEVKGTDYPLVATGTKADKTGFILWNLESAYRMGSDSNGEVSELSLPLGNYYLEEVKAPAGYKQIESRLYFDVKLDASGKMIIAPNAEKNGTDVLPWEISIPDNTVTGIITITVTDEPLELKLSAEKKDPLGAAVPGAEFAVYKDGNPDETNPIATGKSGVNGKIMWTLASGDDHTEKDVLLLVPGHYYIKETKAPVVDGEFEYKGLGDDMIEFKVKIDPTAEGGLVVECAGDEAEPARWTYATAGTGADLALNLTVKNVQQFINLRIVKYGDSYTAATIDEKVPLENAYFKLYKLTSGDDTYGTQSAEWSEVTLGGNIRSGKDGIVRFTDGSGNENLKLKLSYGYYYLQETEAPLGYNIIKDPIYFQIGPDDTTGLGKIEIKNPDNFGSDVVSVGSRDNELLIEMAVTDNMGAELPETGGFGVYPYMLGGLTIVLVAMITLIYKKRSITN